MAKVTITIDVYIDDKSGEAQDDRSDVMEAVANGRFDVVKISEG